MTTDVERLVMFNDTVTVTLPAVSEQQSFTIKNEGNKKIELSNTLFYKVRRDNAGVHVEPKTGINLALARIVLWLCET